MSVGSTWSALIATSPRVLAAIEAKAKEASTAEVMVDQETGTQEGDPNMMAARDH